MEDRFGPPPGDQKPDAPEDRTPSNEEAEAALLGALMVDNRLVDVVTRLQPEHFFWEPHSRIYAAIRELVSLGKVANPVTLHPTFRNDPALQAATESKNGAAYLAQLTGSGAGVIGAKDFADQIVDLYELRKLREIAAEAIERAESCDMTLSAREILSEIESKSLSLFVDAAVKTTVDAGDAADEVLKEVQSMAAGEEPAGFNLHRFNSWNKAVGRMEEGDFIILAARPSMGKTGVAAKVVVAAGEAGVGTDFLSLEMDRRRTTRRVLAQVAFNGVGKSVPYSSLGDGRVSRQEGSLLVEGAARLRELPITISDPDSMYVEDVGPHIRKRKREFERKGQKLKLVVIDYLGRLGTRRRFNSETEATSYISRILKAAAKEEKVTLVVLSQLSRAVEQRENKRPMLSDLRQSGSLEQDADSVVFLYRDEYYWQAVEPPRDQAEKWEKWSEEMDRFRDNLEIYSSKRREGPLAKSLAKFFLRYQAVVDFDDPIVNDAPTFLGDM